ncbi:peptidylprolyl isomerase [Paenibacillus gansuensis]|uniref:Peptidyl-prolyl cis-trans isomerase n=1 Tax=Paenibacillus gansuensis TaxID=306542 RepID=A0ABW5PD95_9BACL
MNQIMKSASALLLAAALITGCGADKTAKPADPGSKQWNEPPAMAISTDKQYKAEFHTSKGIFTIELFAKDAPGTVNNFVFLAKQKYYDGITFHRIIQTYMIQTGDPTGTGRGGPGYTIKDELNNGHTYEPGIVAMAKTAAPDSGGSQFFICTGEQSLQLNSMPDYTIFGKVVSGMDIVQAIAATPVEIGEESTPSKPTEKVTIDSITITEQ